MEMSRLSASWKYALKLLLPVWLAPYLVLRFAVPDTHKNYIEEIRISGGGKFLSTSSTHVAKPLIKSDFFRSSIKAVFLSVPGWLDLRLTGSRVDLP